MALRISLEQWKALVSVVEAGGYAQAASALNKSQSTVSYAIGQIEERLGLTVFRIEGRKAYLTDEGGIPPRSVPPAWAWALPGIRTNGSARNWPRVS